METISRLLKFVFIFSFFVAIIAETAFENQFPKFSDPGVANVTVPVGGEAVFNCTVDNLGDYTIAWLREDLKLILTVSNLVITRNDRIRLTQSNRTWSLHIRDVRKSDRGSYLCQINTSPMSQSQIGYLDIKVFGVAPYRVDTSVHELLTEADEPELLYLVEIFSLQLFHRKVEFSACGFFRLDFTLIYSMVGAIATYIIILMQFNV